MSKQLVHSTVLAPTSACVRCCHEAKSSQSYRKARFCSDTVIRARKNKLQQAVSAGFSMMELIVTVLIIGIIIAIALPFFFNAQDSARQAAVESAARDGQVLAQANIYQGDPTGGNLSSVETGDVVVNFADTFVLGNADTVCVRADWIGTGEATNYAISGPCDESDTTAPIIDREDDDPLYTTLTYQCPDTRSGYLGIINTSDDARVQIWDNSDRDGTIREVEYSEPDANFELRYHARQEIRRTEIVEETGGDVAYADARIRQAAQEADEVENAEEYSMENTVDRVSELVEMEGGVNYTVRFDGEIETFTAPGHRGGVDGNVEESLADCLVSIDHFGDDIGLKNITYLGGRNLTDVPENLPESVMSLRGAFENATNLNDSNISNWDVSNVHTIRSMFYQAKRFNQPLDKWDTSKVTDMSGVFAYNPVFNQDISGWETSNVTTMETMFRNTESFNHDLSGWDVDNVESYTGFGTLSGLEENHWPNFETG